MELNIDLTSPVLILPPLSPTGASQTVSIRGLVTLKLSKATRITDIEINLACNKFTRWPESTIVETRLLPRDEEHVILSATDNLYDWKHTPFAPGLHPQQYSWVFPEALVRDPRSQVTQGPSSRGASPARGGTTTPPTPWVLERLSRALGLENTEGFEFIPLEYTYVFSFEVPPELPPSIELNMASIKWTLTASVRRSSGFTPKVSTSLDLVVIRSPDEEVLYSDLVIERSWDGQLDYNITVPRKSIIVGGTFPFTLSLTPLDKIKVFVITVYLEETISFFTRDRPLPVRTTKPEHIRLLSLRKKDNTQLLPPVGPNDGKTSPLSSILIKGDRDTGPWVIQQDIKMPPELLNPSHTNQSGNSNVRITHSFNVRLRVQRGNSSVLEDLTIDAPVTVLSSRLTPQWNELPLYSPDPEPESSRSRDSSRGRSPTTPDECGITEAERLERHAQFDRLMSGKEDMLGCISPIYQ